MKKQGLNRLRISRGSLTPLTAEMGNGVSIRGDDCVWEAPKSAWRQKKYA